MSRLVDVENKAAHEQPLQVVQFLPALFLPRPLTRGFQEILIHRAFDFVEPGPIIGFRFWGVVLFFRSHVFAFQAERFSICCKDTWHGWPEESTGAFSDVGRSQAGPLASGPYTNNLPNPSIQPPISTLPSPTLNNSPPIQLNPITLNIPLLGAGSAPRIPFPSSLLLNFTNKQLIAFPFIKFYAISINSDSAYSAFAQ